MQKCNNKGTYKYNDRFDRNTSFTVFIQLNVALEWTLHFKEKIAINATLE